VANLAVAMAQAGLKVTLVDADLRRPRIHKLFEVHARGGLTGSLVEGALNGRVQQGEVNGLNLLPAGELPPNPAELLGSQRMGELLEELAQEADVVLVDSPPVLPVADTVVLGAQVDGVILVIDVGQTRRGFAQQAVENLRQVDANVIGVVLNRVPTSGAYYYYYYGDNDYANGNAKRRRWHLGFAEPLASIRRLVRRVKR
jgi:capsular exopolysaccharide synthesis family protein